VPTSGVDRLATAAANPELTERPRRRRFTAEYKLSILSQADACQQHGALGALLRREGLYSSHLDAWRKQREAGALAALRQSRGRRKIDARDVEIGQLRRRAERAEAELAKAKKVIEVQGNVSALLGIMLEPSSVLADEPSDPTSAPSSSKVSRNSRR
jgi:transposase-like protein